MSRFKLTHGQCLAALALIVGMGIGGLQAQERLPWRSGPSEEPPPAPYRPDAYRPSDPYGTSDQYRQGDTRQGDAYRSNDVYRQGDTYRQSDAYRPSEPSRPLERSRPDDAYRPPASSRSQIENYRSGRGYTSDTPPPEERGYGAPYTPGPQADVEPYERNYGRGDHDRAYERGGPAPSRHWNDGQPSDRTYSQNEIMSAGHRFFGSVSQGLASVIEYAFKNSGRPNGYILGEDAGGAFVAGLRYGEGMLHTKDAGTHRVYWQGPSLGYDFGAEGSKTMVLVYNLRDPAQIYNRFGGVQGSAYVVGGVGIQFQKNDDIVLAPIRAGIGLRFGANVGYLKYTRSPTWNPF